MLTIAVLLGLANWIATTIVVESELTRPAREWLDRRGTRTRPIYNEALGGRTMWSVTERRPVVDKLRYLIGCHLCAGTWIALVEACFVTIGLSSGLAGIVLSALCYKAVGHTALNINARLAP